MEPTTHQVVFEKHPITSLIVAIVVFFCVLCSFSLAATPYNRKQTIALNGNITSGVINQNITLQNLLPYHKYADVYLILSVSNITLQTAETNTIVYEENGEQLFERTESVTVECENDECEQFLLASISPIRSSTYAIQTTISTGLPITNVRFSLEYGSYQFSIFSVVTHGFFIFVNSIIMVICLFFWRKKPVKEWNFEHTYFIVILFFDLLAEPCFFFFYLYEIIYFLWVIQTFQCLFLLMLFLYFIVTLTCINYDYKPNSGSILLDIGVIIGQLCTMIGLILYNGIENIKSNTHLVPNEIYVLISGLAFTNILYILVCCYHTYCIIRSHRTIKQFLAILLFCVSVGILLVITTYNMYYIRLIPPISFESTLTFSYEFILMGLACLTFGFYNTNNDYSIVNDEIPLEDEKNCFSNTTTQIPIVNSIK
ncbi:Wntless-like transmembrane domain-containing protein [Entamoeba marina]